MSEVKDVFVVNGKANGEKDQWFRIGAAFVNRDDSLNVVLDALPMTNRLHIRKRQIKNNQQSTERRTK